ncbi:MAG: TlpA family protein disulfide reductase [Candidatus Tyrphobacter sp.]
MTLLALAACAASSSHVGTIPGDKAPPWSDPLSTGGTLSFASLRGSPVYLDFFATWCPPCNVEAPWIQGLQRQYAKRGLRIVGVDMQENATLVQRFRAKYSLTYPIVVDSGTLQRLYDINGLPVHVFIARNGTIERVVVGEMAHAAIESAVKTVLR